MKVEAAVFWYKRVLMGNKESSLPGPIVISIHRGVYKIYKPEGPRL